MKAAFRAAFLALTTYSVLASAAKINTPRVLLPWLDASTRVNFTFEITEGGCYTWSLSRDDLVSLEPLYENSWGHCSRAAVATPLPTCSCCIPGSVIILAEDVITGEIIRGDLNVDKISSLRIVSTTWKLYLEEAPEAFEVEVFDDQGNKFSSLEGVEFTWKVENVQEKKNEEPVVKLVWWRDTDYEAPPGISELESQGRRSHSVLLYGQTMGEASVIACLNTTCSHIALRVVASVVLNPAAALVAPGDAVRYKVIRARAGRLTVEDVGDTLYRLHVPDEGIARLEDAISLVEARTIGSTFVSLLSGSTEVASSTLTVVNPHSIRVYLRPASFLVRGEPFVIRAMVLDKQGRALTAGEKMLVRLAAEGNADIKLIRSTENGTLTDAVAHSEGSATITAVLHSVGGRTLSRKVEGTTEATVVEPLEIIPPELFIAWTDTRIEVQLSHRGGGEGSVAWNSDQSTGQVEVDKAGLVRADSVGHTVVRAHLTEHPHVRAQSDVWVLEAQYVQVASSGHARVGRPHVLHVALTGTHTDDRMFTFHKCDCNSFAVTLLEGPEPQNVTAATWIQPLEGACCVLTAVWSERGACVMRVSRGNIGDTARVLVRAAPKLVWPHAAAMLLGASLPVLAAGEELAARMLDPAIVDVRLRSPPTPHAHPDLQLFTISCLRKGETSLELRSLSEEEEETGGETEVACASRASRIKLDTPTCNCSGGARMWMRAGGRVIVTVTLLDAAGRELLDELGHKVTWETIPSNSALEYASPKRLLIETDPEYDPVPVPLRYHQEVRAGEASVGWSGSIRATAGDVSATILARVVAPLSATPHYASVAWEGSTASSVATVSGGSGRYSVETGKGASASLEDGRLSGIWPRPGRYQLLVTDSCLLHETVTVEVRVEEVISVEVSGPRAVCVDTCVTLAATAHGVTGRALVASSAPVWRVSEGAELRESRLCGVREGTVTVRAAIAGVWSPELEVVVFPVLGIRPERVRVPPGARLQLTHVGGPPARLATFTYTASQPDHTLMVSQSGLLSGLRVGSGRVRLTAKDKDGAEMTHAEADVEVVGVTGVRGVAATNTLLVGAEAPLWLEAAPALGPEALAALHPAPRVTWTLRDPDAATLKVPLRAIQSVDKSTAEGVSVRLTPLRDGLITVDVKVRNFVQGGETRSWDTVVEVLAVAELTVSVEGSSVENVSPEVVAVSVGGTVRLRSSLRAVWSAWAAPAEEPVFEISPSGVLKALRNGFGVAVGRYRDEKNNYERETVVHVEVSNPHYMTTQVLPDDEDTILSVEARSSIGRRLLAQNLTLYGDRRLNLHARPSSRVSGTEAIVTGVDNAGTFAVIEASTGAVVLRDYIFLEAPDRTSERITTGAGRAVCLQGGGWRASGEDVWLGERGEVTLVVLQSQDAGRVHLKADRPARSVTIAYSPATKMEFLAGDWPAALVPLFVESAVGGDMVQCTEEQRSALADVQPTLPFVCRVDAPFTAKPVLDTFLGQIGCSVTSDRAVTEAHEVETCAEWSALRACTRILLLPPVRITTDRLTLTDKAETFTVVGHESALKSLTVTSSPGIETHVESTPEGVQVKVWSEERECGAGWVWVRSRRTAQALRLAVLRECDVTCGSLLAIAFQLIQPHLLLLIVLVAFAAIGFYVYSKFMMQLSSLGKPAPPVAKVVKPPPSPMRTWPRSPYASPKAPPSPNSPVYGDTSLLPDSSFSPNSQTHSRFL